jgi:hypothetical protein
MSETSDNETGWGLVVSFSGLYPTMAEEHAFVHGVEFGALDWRMEHGQEAEIRLPTHTANRKVIQRAAATRGWEVASKPSEIEGWDYTELRKVAAQKRPNPHGLRVVKE